MTIEEKEKRLRELEDKTKEMELDDKIAVAEKKLKDKQFEKTIVGQVKKNSSDDEMDDDEEGDFIGIAGFDDDEEE